MSYMTLAMHMANELLSVKVAALTGVLAAGLVLAASHLARRTMESSRLPLMGVMGAFVFAAQMINFPILPGASGHLGGAVLLAILLGPWSAIVTMTAILIVQCLLFQDGGLLALGCNILNMGVVPALLGWGVYRGIVGRVVRGEGVSPAAVESPNDPTAGVTPARQYLAAWAAATVGVTAGAALVPVEASLSGVLQIPFAEFLLVMVGVHLLIGLVEGAITFVVLAYLRRVRPEAAGVAALQTSEREARPRLGRSVVVSSILGTAVVLAGVVSVFASARPDGLEWALGQHQAPLASPSPAVAVVEQLQSKVAPLPDYAERQAPLGQANPPGTAKSASASWTSLAGLIGTGVTVAVVCLVGGVLRKRGPASGSSHPHSSTLNPQL